MLQTKMIEGGDLDGLYLTGLTEEAIKLLSNYVDWVSGGVWGCSVRGCGDVMGVGVGWGVGWNEQWECERMWGWCGDEMGGGAFAFLKESVRVN